MLGIAEGRSLAQTLAPSLGWQMITLSRVVVQASLPSTKLNVDHTLVIYFINFILLQNTEGIQERKTAFPSAAQEAEKSIAYDPNALLLP